MDDGVSHIIPKADQPKIISAQVSDQKILMWCLFLSICMIRISWL